MSHKSIVIIGAGHNALVCACYLAREGHDVSVFERRSRVGGAVNTEEMWGGYQVDTCSVMHILIHKTPIVEELGLRDFGLDYMQMDPWGFAPFPDGEPILFYRDLDRTCQSIARLSERDAEAYRAFVARWDGFNQQVFDAFSRSPQPGALVGGIAWRTTKEQLLGLKPHSGPRGQADPSMSGLLLLRTVLGNYGRMLDETFTNARLKAAIAWMAAQSGPPPSEIGAGALAGAHSLYHDVGATHPRGGSGMLAQALARCLEQHGGTIRCEAPVERILTSNGRVTGVKLEGGERIPADVVVSGAHVRTTFLDLLGRENLPAHLRSQIESLRVGNGIGMTVRCAIDELPNYERRTMDDGRQMSDDDANLTHHASSSVVHRPSSVVHNGMQLICPSMEYLQRAYDDSQRGYPAERPALVAMTPSAVDQTIAPPGKHLLYIWAQYHPYALADGQNWDDIREREADHILQTLAEYAPNVAGSVTHRYIQSPLDLERNVGLLRGNIMHIEMSLDQMFMFRPLPELSQYRTPVEGLYLTGASTHPGGGVSGASGRNAASTVLANVKEKRQNWRGWALGGVGVAAAALAMRRKKRDA